MSHFKIISALLFSTKFLIKLIILIVLTDFLITSPFISDPQSPLLFLSFALLDQVVEASE